jgi:hypothetical protein
MSCLYELENTFDDNVLALDLESNGYKWYLQGSIDRHHA